MKLVIFGKPQSGKGTFAELIARDFGLVHISSGDIFRENKEKFAKHIDKGEFVPDDVVIDIFKKKLKGVSDFILDGFPRTLKQAEECSIGFDKAILLECSDETVMKRFLGRVTCSKCKSIFNVNTETAPKKKGVCDNCRGELIKREDDVDVDLIKKRLDIYHKETEPVVEFYRKKNIVAEVDANRTVDLIYADIKSLLNK